MFVCVCVCVCVCVRVTCPSFSSRLFSLPYSSSFISSKQDKPRRSIVQAFSFFLSLLLSIFFDAVVVVVVFCCCCCVPPSSSPHRCYNPVHGSIILQFFLSCFFLSSFSFCPALSLSRSPSCFDYSRQLSFLAFPSMTIYIGHSQEAIMTMISYVTLLHLVRAHLLVKSKFSREECFIITRRKCPTSRA